MALHTYKTKLSSETFLQQLNEAATDAAMIKIVERGYNEWRVTQEEIVSYVTNDIMHELLSHVSNPTMMTNTFLVRIDPKHGPEVRKDVLANLRAMGIRVVDNERSMTMIPAHFWLKDIVHPTQGHKMFYFRESEKDCWQDK